MTTIPLHVVDGSDDDNNKIIALLNEINRKVDKLESRTIKSDTRTDKIEEALSDISLIFNSYKGYNDHDRHVTTPTIYRHISRDSVIEEHHEEEEDGEEGGCSCPVYISFDALCCCINK